MRILFTGGNGFLGRNVVPLLSEKGFEVAVLAFEDAEIIADLSKEVPKLSDHYDAVFHAAGKAHVIPKSKEEAEAFFQVNLNGTKNLCTALENNLPKHFIFISTVAVYGKDFGENISEDDELKGATPYAKSKIEAEQFLQVWCEKNNVNLTILRPSLIAGNNAPGNLGDLANAIEKGRYFHVGSTEALKSVVWVEDFADIIELALQKNGGIYNVTNSEQPSFRTIANKIAERKNKKIVTVPYFVIKTVAIFGDLLGNKAPINSLKLDKITKSLTFANDKIKTELGWIPTSVLEKL